MAEFRIEYSIQRNLGDEDWKEVGFGSSGAWGDIDSAVHIVESEVQNRNWETEPGMPNPDEMEG